MFCVGYIGELWIDANVGKSQGIEEESRYVSGNKNIHAMLFEEFGDDRCLAKIKLLFRN